MKLLQMQKSSIIYLWNSFDCKRTCYAEFESYLNVKYGPGSALSYASLALIRGGVYNRKPNAILYA